MNNLKKCFITIFSIVLIAVLLSLAYYYFEIKTYYYYSQIDNTKITKLDTTSDLKYEYKLLMYDENSKQKEIEFKTYKELKEDSFIKVKYLLISGVNTWEEVEYNKLPIKVKEKYKNTNKEINVDLRNNSSLN